MTDATYIPPAQSAKQRETVPLVAYRPQPLSAPVFIHDCVTPLGGETVLSLLMKRMMAED